MATWKRFTPNNNDTNSVEKYSPDSDESTTHVPTESWVFFQVFLQNIFDKYAQQFCY